MTQMTKSHTQKPLSYLCMDRTSALLCNCTGVRLVHLSCLTNPALENCLSNMILRIINKNKKY
jgi:hypothetical protein